MISPSDRQRIVRDALIAGMLPWVRLQARRMVRRDRRLDFDDLVQAGSIALLDAAADFNGTGSFFLHAKSPVRWRMTDQAKAMRRQPAHADGVDRICAGQPTQIQLVQRGEIRAALAAILTRQEAIVFTFYFVEQCSAEEIAALVGGTQRCIARLLARMIHKLAADSRLRALAGVARAPSRTPGEVKQRLNGAAAPKEGRRAGNGSPRTDAGISPSPLAGERRGEGQDAPSPNKTAGARCSRIFSSLTTGGPRPITSCDDVPPRRCPTRSGGVFSSLLHPALSA